MIAYLDTSVFVSILLVAESSSAACARFWDSAEAVVSNRLLYVEAASALARGARGGRLVGDQYETSRSFMNRLFEQVDLIEVDEQLVRDAADLTHHFELRGYDAVHCAAATALFDAPDLVAASGDKRLLAAWRELGVATFDPAAPA